MSIKDLIRKKVVEYMGRKYESMDIPMKLVKSPNLSAGVAIPSSAIPDDSVLNIKDILVEKVSRQEDNLFFTINKHQLINHCLSSQKIDFKKLRRKIMVEYSSPNIAKPFHFGHLRSTIVGHFVANILSKYDDVVRLNYLGDWGTQMGFVKLGLEGSHNEENPIKMMYKSYIKAYSEPGNIEKAREIFYKLESDDLKETLEWVSIKKAAVDNLKKTYSILGINFDEFAYESDFRMHNIKKTLNYFVDNNIAFFNEDQMGMNINGVFTPLLRKDGTTLYLSRDIASALERYKKHECDKILYIVDKGQSNHLENLRQAVELVTKKDLVEHIPFGKVVGMSTRKGTSIFLDDILECVCKKMAEQQTKSLNTKTTDFETTRTLGLSALFVYILKLNRQRDFKFDWDAALQGSGDSGVKLQYTHSRLKSLEDKFSDRIIESCEPSLLQEDIVLDLIILISEFDETLVNSKNNLESYYLVKYLFKLCNLTAKALKLLPVKNQPEDIGNQRLLLFNKVRLVLNEGMRILGLKALEKM